MCSDESKLQGFVHILVVLVDHGQSGERLVGQGGCRTRSHVGQGNRTQNQEQSCSPTLPDDLHAHHDGVFLFSASVAYVSLPHQTPEGLGQLAAMPTSLNKNSQSDLKRHGTLQHMQVFTLTGCLVKTNVYQWLSRHCSETDNMKLCPDFSCH